MDRAQGSTFERLLGERIKCNEYRIDVRCEWGFDEICVMESRHMKI